MAKDSGGFVKSKAKGIVNFPPFESLNDHFLREIRRYQIYPWGKIQEYCRHIPYNSGKKDFYDKTGRESFEVFQYIFKVSGDETEYTVMWDYNVGLVRMTPFFKCCKYSKTQPAKMLNLNPGLRDITHSITGGSIAAQGYWMPFACAKAVCTTFCASIAGALIPIFGPDFPSLCISPDAPEHGRMQIDPMIVMESAREAEMFRRMYANAASVAANSHLTSQHQQHHSQHHHAQIHHYSHGPALPSPTSIPSPRLDRRGLPRYDGSPQEYDDQRLAFEERMRFKHGSDNPYRLASEPEVHSIPELQHALASHTLARGGMPYSPVSPPRSSSSSDGWTVPAHSAPHQEQAHAAHARPRGAYHYSSAYQETRGFPYASASNPILSAIPRSSHGSQQPEQQHHQHQHQHYHSQHLPHPQPSHLPSRLPPLSSPTTWSTPHNNSTTNNNVYSSKRPAADILQVSGDFDDYSDKSSPTTTVTTSTSTSQEDAGPDHPSAAAAAAAVASSGTDKNAAFLLLNLSVRDQRGQDVRGCSKEAEEEQAQRERSGQRMYGTRGCGPESMSMSPVSGAGGQDGHRSKRRRATSM